MKRIHILVSDEMYEELNAEANRSSVSMSELLRRAWDTSYGSAAPKVVEIMHRLGRRPGRRLDLG